MLQSGRVKLRADSDLQIYLQFDSKKINKIGNKVSILACYMAPSSDNKTKFQLKSSAYYNPISTTI